MRKFWKTTAALMTIAGAAGGASAQQFADASDVIVVTATRTAQSVDDVPATVSVIDDREIENNLANDIKDLVRFEPGVSVQSAPARFSATAANSGRSGNAGFNVRGLDGNRVLIVVDGVRVPDSYSFGPALAIGRGDYVDVDLLRSVEIVRGPASALYGSDGVAGAVSFVMRDPSDVLAGDESYTARVRAGYASADESWAESVLGAGRWGDWSALFSYTRRDGSETDNQGDRDVNGPTRTAPNPQEWSSNAALARLVFQPNAAHRFRLTADYSDRDIDSDILSEITGSSLRVLATDRSQRARVSLDHVYENEGGLIDRAQWNIYYQTSEATQYTFNDRSPGPGDRWRLAEFVNDVWGAALQLDSTFETGSIEHHLTYGADYSLTNQEGLRSGGPSPVPGTLEILPARPFPNTEYTLAGVFIQDEISILDGQLVLYPALRYDSYELDPEADALYYAGDPPVGQSESHVSPKLGVVVWPIETFGAYFNYASGFRAPAPRQVNEFFENAIANYTSIPNPNLRPETSDSVEIGVRWRDIDLAGASWRASVAGYAGWYEDFIDQTVVDPTPVTVFQYVNLAEVQISGVELRVDGRWDNGIGAIVSAARSDGDYLDLSTNERAPLDSIDPWKIVAGLTYDDPLGRYGGQLITTFVGDKEANDVDAALYRPDGYTVIDITAYWNITGAATARIGLFNVTDEKYWQWSDVRGISSIDATNAVDAFTSPGANFSASLSYRF